MIDDTRSSPSASLRKPLEEDWLSPWLRNTFAFFRLLHQDPDRLLMPAASPDVIPAHRLMVPVRSARMCTAPGHHAQKKKTILHPELPRRLADFARQFQPPPSV
jgi:hypothetical protein